MSTSDKLQILITDNFYHQLVWDYNWKPEEFLAMLEEPGEELSYNKRWAMVRTLERADYYRAMKLIDKTELKQHWAEVKPKLRHQFLKDSYEFVLSR
jgi:hypothetical protein